MEMSPRHWKLDRKLWFPFRNNCTTKIYFFYIYISKLSYSLEQFRQSNRYWNLVQHNTSNLDLTVCLNNVWTVSIFLWALGFCNTARNIDLQFCKKNFFEGICKGHNVFSSSCPSVHFCLNRHDTRNRKGGI